MKAGDGSVEVNLLVEAGFRIGACVFGASIGEEFRDRQRQLVLGDDFDDSVGSTAQRKWIFRPGRLQSQGEHASDAVGFIGDGEHCAFDRRWHLVVHRFRLVLVINRVANRSRGGSRQKRIELLDLGVESADDALQFGELLHQFGGEIGLGQQRRLEHHSRADRDARLANHLGNQARKFLHAKGLVEVAAQVLLEGHDLQHFDAIAQRDLLVGVPEEARVVEAGTQDALVAVANQAVGIAVGIEHGEEVRQQVALGVFEREVLLVVAHHGDQHLGGQCRGTRDRSCRERPKETR